MKNRFLGYCVGAVLVMAVVVLTAFPTTFRADNVNNLQSLPNQHTVASTENYESWVERAKESIEQGEYQASENSRGVQAPNRAHNLRMYFLPWGVRVEDRTAEGSPELVRMRTVGVGREGRMSGLSNGDVRTIGARVENQRGRGIIEWYENGEGGLEHGYVFDGRPPGEGELRIEVTFEGGSVAVRDGRAVITTPERRLEYGNLVVEDAMGREVASRMEAVDGVTVCLTVEDDGAVYPLVVDPLLTSMADAVLQSDQASANMGISVAGAGDVNGDGYADVIVGANLYDAGQTDEGAAFVFYGGPAGIANGNPGTANTVLQSDQANANMGVSVAGVGDVNGDGYADVIVGASLYDAGQTDEGAAFVFHGGPAGIANGNPGTANATLQSNQASANMGISVAGAGDVNGDGYAEVIIGANLYDSGQTDEGAAFVFHGGPTGVANGNPGTANATLQANQAVANMGISVAGAGDVNGDGYAEVIVGAMFYDAGQTDEGAAFVFHGGPSGIANGNPGTANATLEANQVGAHMGVSVAGAGYVNGDGYADVIVGANLYDAGQLNEGAAFVFHGGPAGIANGNPGTANATLQSNQASAQMGVSVAGAGDVSGDGYADVIVGAPSYNLSGPDEGAAFVYYGGPAGIANGTPGTAGATLGVGQSSAAVGNSVAGAGDVNGDGYADVIVGANLYDAGQTDEGAAFVALGGAEGVRSGNPGTANATLQADQAIAFMGISVAGAGDVNGDGYSDVIVGASLYDAGETDEGAAFVFHGGPAGIANGNPGTANTTLQSNQVDAQMGATVAGAGDVNGDGYADVIVGAVLYDAGQTDEGAAFVFLGGPSGIPNGNPGTANATLQSDQANANTSTNVSNSVAGAGDVNGDGYADVIVGAVLYDAGQTDEGAAFVFLGGPMGIANGNPATANAVLQANQAGAQMGISVAGAGDVNGDGYADVIVGAIGLSVQSLGGGALVFHGGPMGIANGNPATANAVLEANQSGAQMGNSVSGAGDVNGDGYADVIVGAFNYDAGQTDEGVAFVFHGGPSGIANGNPGTANATLQSDRGLANLGRSVAGAGDVNGDGYADVIVGSWFYGSGPMENGEGHAFLFYGNGDGLGRTVLSRQLRGNGNTTNVEPWGSSMAGDFQVRMTATHPEGRGRVKLEIEAVPVGETWGGPNSVAVVSSTWTDVTATSAGVTLTETVAGLDPLTLYRWRARVLYAPFMFTSEPANPVHSPWRRVHGQAIEADIQTAGCRLTCPADITTTAVPGQCTAVATFTPVVEGMCGTVTCSPASGSAFPVGVTTVTCSEMGGAMCTFTVTVTDTQAPSVACPPNVTANSAAGQCNAIVSFATPTAVDNCPGATVVCAPASGSAFVVGTTTVVCTATDAGGNTSQCTFTVTVVDNQAPSVVCPANVTTNAGTGQCSAATTYATPTAVDNCPGATVVCAPASGSTFVVGTTTVVCTATDASSNTSQCTFTVTVVDNQAPLVVCPASVTTNVGAGQCSAVVTFTTPTATDNCPGATVVCAPASGSTFVVGTTTVTCAATDASSNTSQCTFTVTVVDNQAPSVVCPASVTTNVGAGQCSAVVTFTTPTAVDNCPGATVVCAPASGSTLVVGTTTVVCTATDTASNMTQCTFTVTVVDAQAPSVACPANVTTNASVGQCSAVTTYATPTAVDNCPGATVVCAPASGSAFVVGTTTVVCTATDASSNTSQCTFTVTVVDNQAPSVVCPANVTTNAASGQCSAVVSFTATATDNCPGATVVCKPTSGSTFVVGTTTVTCAATDASSNMAQCSFTVTVVDNQAPSVVCPASVTTNVGAGQCSAVVTFTTPTAIDNCPGATVVCAPASGATFAVGTTTVVCTATDTASNMTQCTFTVTVVDAQVPSVACPANVTTNASVGQCSAVVTFTTPTATDNCPGATVVCAPASGSTFVVGTTTVVCTATDAGGNTSQCTFTVTVVDAQAPSVVCPANVIATGTGTTGCLATALVTYPNPTVTDNCPGATFACVPPSGSTFMEGVTSVTCTATDTAGNTSACSFTVVVGVAFTFCAVDDTTGDRFQIDTNPASATYRLWRYTIAATNTRICGAANSLTHVPGVKLVAYDNDFSSENPTYYMSANFTTSGTVTIRKKNGTTVAFLRDRNLLNSSCP